MRYLDLIILCFLLSSCTDDMPSSSILAEYIEQNNDLTRDELIACAGGRAAGLFDGDSEPTSVIYLPVEGATEIRYYESTSLLDSLDFSAYFAKDVDREPILGGKLWKFNIPPFQGEKMSLVSYKTDGKLHICNPIRLKTNPKPTEVNADLVTIQSSGVNPSFNWNVGTIDENAIYFQVISDEQDNFISGTYTFDQNFTFYELDNVVLNITDPTSNPTLLPNTTYKFTLMGVSLDNWVNLYAEKSFVTE